jgi:hypothetical protein
MRRNVCGLLVTFVCLLTTIHARAESGPSDCSLTTTSGCKVVTSASTCQAQCTGGAFISECENECTAMGTTACTNTCTTRCMTSCTAAPMTFDCTADCTSDCQGSCASACSGQGSGCMPLCTQECSNRCTVVCAGLTSANDCTDQCQSACYGSCGAQANLACESSCTANVAPAECAADCTSGGGIFCGTQYIDFDKLPDGCEGYLAGQGITSHTSGSTGATGSTTSGKKSSSGCEVVGFHAAPVSALALLWIGMTLLGLRRRRT